MACLWLAFSVSPAMAAWTERAYAVPSRPGVEQRFVVAGDARISDRNAVKHVVMIFPGGAGATSEPATGTLEQAPGNLRSLRGYLAEQLGVAVSIGLPSDQEQGLSLEWRGNAEQVKDAVAVADALLKQYPEARITLLGFSNGAKSASNVAAAMASVWGSKLRGMVLMSSFVSAFRGEWIRALEGGNERAKTPLLVLHHKRDSCLPYSEIEAAAKWHDVITVDDVNKPRVSPFRRDCDKGSAHQFAGREDWAYAALAEWIKTGKVTEPGQQITK